MITVRDAQRFLLLSLPWAAPFPGSSQGSEHTAQSLVSHGGGLSVEGDYGSPQCSQIPREHLGSPVGGEHKRLHGSQRELTTDKRLQPFKEDKHVSEPGKVCLEIKNQFFFFLTGSEALNYGCP